MSVLGQVNVNQICEKFATESHDTNENLNIWSEKEVKGLEELKKLIQDDISLEDFVNFFQDSFLLSFVKGKKFDYLLAHETLRNYINVRRHQYLHLFKHLLPSTTATMRQGVVRKLKYTDQFNRVVIVNRIRLWDPQEIEAHDAIKWLTLLMDEFMRVEAHDSEGIVAIFDMTGYSLGHAKVITPATALVMLNLLWKNVPVRFKALHIYNEIWIFTMLLKAVRVFLPKKVKERIYVHSTNLEAVHDHVPKEILPKSLGGPIEDDEAFDDTVEERIYEQEDYYRRFASKL